MSDEQPPEAGGPSDAAAEPPTTPTPAVEAPSAEAAEPATPSTAEPGHRSGVQVPRWAAFLVAALVLVGVGFAIGWIAAPGGGTQTVSRPAGGFFPRGPGAGAGAGRLGGGFAGQGSGAFLGVEVQPATGSPQGASVVIVQSGSPADQAGLKAGDVITAVNGSTVTTPAQLSQDVQSHQPGDTVTVTYTRSGTSSQAQVKLGTRPSPSVQG